MNASRSIFASSLLVGAMAPTQAAFAQQQTIKIGAIDSCSGPMALYGA